MTPWFATFRYVSIPILGAVLLAGPGGEAPPLTPDPLSAGDRSRSPDPGPELALAVTVTLRPDPWKQVEARGS
ncbi:Hypothetical protein HVPorG_04207a [Roseomonas mucosa]|nr:Hypothetical protein HVPorG_04207a [Roseomonas mucosa]